MPLDLSYLFTTTVDLDDFNRLLKSSLSKKDKDLESFEEFCKSQKSL